MAGLSFEAICERLGRDYPPEEVAAQKFALHEHCERLRNHAPLRPLLDPMTTFGAWRVGEGESLPAKTESG